MRDVFICDAVRTPIGRFGGSLAKVRADDLAAVPIKALMAKHPNLDWKAVDEVFFGCANQAGEDNRNVARMALLLAGLPDRVPGATVNRLCASSPEPHRRLRVVPGTLTGNPASRADMRATLRLSSPAWLAQP